MMIMVLLPLIYWLGEKGRAVACSGQVELQEQEEII